jgi:hypothetical protein
MRADFEVTIQASRPGSDRITLKAGVGALKFQPKSFAWQSMMPRGDDGPLNSGMAAK